MLRQIPHRAWLVAIALGFSTLTLTACEDEPGGEVGEAIEDTGDAVEDTGEEVEDTAD